MELIYKRLANLLSIKSIVTITSTAVFALLSIRGVISGGEFLSVFTMIAGFYFGTQAKKEDS